jgi:hypothetical protein
MSDTITPIKAIPVEVEKSIAKGDNSSIEKIDIEAPFTHYKEINHHSYIVDHFKLGDTWKDKLGGFENEVSLIEDYFKEEIGKGNIKDDISSVKSKMDKLYKLCDIDKSERITMQIEKLSAYLEFLKKTENIKTKNYGQVE